MGLEYVKHNRPVTIQQMNDYGKLSDHDLHIPCLLLYELGKIKDKNGTEVIIDRDFINYTLKQTNNWIKNRHSLPHASTNNAWNRPIEEVRAISLIKNHNVSDVDNTVGHNIGLVYLEEIKGILSLITNVAIERPTAKEDVLGNLLRQISIGTRPDGSIKEISFVVNEAAPLCGLMFSEKNLVDKLLFRKPNKIISLPNSGLMINEEQPIILSEPISVIESNMTPQQIELSEQISSLEFAEQELQDIIIPNHLILSKLIKTGRLMPYKYDDLIRSNNKQALQLMEQSLPSQELGIMFGTNREPEKINTAELKFEEAINLAKDNLGIKSKNKEENPKMFELIRQNKSQTELRAKELKHILELTEHSPDIATKYIKIELGEPAENIKYSDTLLTEYLGQLKETKNQLSKLKQLQLGE